MHQWPWFFPEVFKKTGHSSCLCPFTLFVLEIFIVQVLGGGESEPITFSWPSHHHTTKPCSCRHLPCYLVPDQGKAKGGALESSATYTELQWVALRDTWNSPSWLPLDCIHHRFVPAVSDTQGRTFSWDSLEGDVLGVKLPGLHPDTKRILHTINCVWSLPFPSKTDDYLGASSAVWQDGGL